LVLLVRVVLIFFIYGVLVLIVLLQLLHELLLEQVFVIIVLSCGCHCHDLLLKHVFGDILYLVHHLVHPIVLLVEVKRIV
jgi:hypothetical protein